MSRKIFIFCEECGTRLEVDEDDPRVFCEECGAEIENVRYRPAEDEEVNIFSANIEEEQVATDNVEAYEDSVEEYESEYVVENVVNDIEDTAQVSVNTITNTFVSNNQEVYYDEEDEEDEDGEVSEIFVDHEYVEDVTEGTPVTYYAVLERRGRFFTGECPEVPFTSVDKADSFEECVEEIKDELEERVNSFGGKDYHQPRYEDLQAMYPQADIIEITVMKRK